MMQTLRIYLLTALFSLVLSGCVYKIDVQQGNIITDQDIQKIHRGMTVAAVEKLLGTPLLINVYKTNRLYYVYTMKHGRNPRSERQLFIYFNNDQRVTNYITHTSVAKKG